MRDGIRPVMKRSDRLPEDAMVLSTQDVRRQLKIIAALTGSSMKDVLARLVAAEFKRVAPHEPAVKS
jgi:hypothetical protein